MKANQKLVSITGTLLLVALIALTVSMSFWAFRQSENALEVRRHTNALILRANALMSELKDAETGQRGYLLTGNETFLEPYLMVLDTITGHLDQLRQLNATSTANKSLKALVPLIDAKITALSEMIELRRNNDMARVLTLANDGKGQQLMNAIQTEMRTFIQAKEAEQARDEAALQLKMRNLLAIIVFSCLLTLLFALSFPLLIYRKSQQRTQDLLHLETHHLLENQEAMNKQLQQTNLKLRVSEEGFSVTLNSIGDAVIATDSQARVTLLNPLAEQLTGWSLAEASGRPVYEIFNIINKKSRQPATIPLMETLTHGTVQGLTNHTVLIARNGSECDIADSCAPIRDRDNQVIGAVLVFRDVTGEYAAQQELHDSNAMIQTILNTVVDGIITLHARGGIIETVNPAAENMFGYSAKDLMGQNFSTLIPELDQDQRNGSLEYYSASKEARAVGLGREVSGRRKDGSRFPMEIAVSEMWLGGERYFTGLLRDITARKQAEETLIKAGALQNAIYNSANFLIIATDVKGVIQIFNVGAERMLGYASADVMNKITPAEISDPQELITRAKELSAELSTPIMPGFEALVFKASRGIEDIYELTFLHKESIRLPAVVSVTALLDAQDQIIGYLLIGTDNSARKRIEEERTLLNEALQDKNTELQSARLFADKANRAKSDFLSRMSHELRTPLNAILGFAQLLEAGSPKPTDIQIIRLQEILKAGWYLLDLINEILDLALIESGKLSLSQEPVSLIDLIIECQAMIEPKLQERDITLTIMPFTDASFIFADRTRVKQALINLLSNAIKYNCEHGTIEVKLSSNTPDRIRISITDSGMGLSQEKLEQLFQPFNRLGQENGNMEGTGIGLVVTKQLVELMGGNIGVESKMGVGSVFWIELIRDDSSPFTGTQSLLKDLLAPKTQAHGELRTLLYVEDNPANLMLVEQIIESLPHLQMLSARNANLGIALAKSHLPDVILMDINLPGISGLKALKILHEDPITAHIPVVALSANAMPRDIEKGLAAGFFRYLTKPIKINEFMCALDDALQFAEMDYSGTLKDLHETGQN
ncbi:PAS domain S-box protein [Methylicorpusculum sp.]|uniref:PAS domain S-box protein n=2 Tax=Methylicorpusculum sp. TaxID=2713644 RepID=UPI002731A40D|nr:PAS domain S-box protein [Methylicorpusculum sp.]MDP2176913.1 PAS domain S-box protein [Methylicorpusculum sp.]MDP3530236.1 PAS domain S-box protein [Methylicorpusculum sp.]